MRVQFMAAVILGLTLSPALVFSCTCAAPPPEVKTASELAAWTSADAIFEGKVESVELIWKLKEAQIGDVIPFGCTQSYDLPAPRRNALSQPQVWPVCRGQMGELRLWDDSSVHRFASVFVGGASIAGLRGES